MAFLFLLTACASKQEYEAWEDTAYAISGPGLVPYLIYEAIKAAAPSKARGPLESSSFSSICDSARNGDGASRSSIAWHYRNGWAPVSADPVEAYKWFSLADVAGYENAMKFRTELAKEMSAEQVAEGERRAATWSAPTETCDFPPLAAEATPVD